MPAFLTKKRSSETTSTTLSGATWFLTQNPDAYAKLAHEVRSAFSSVDEINMVSTQSLKYLFGVMEETLRLYHPVPGVAPRVIAKGGATVNGYFLPAGTIINIPHYAMYHATKYWADTESFLPERWLGTDPRFEHDNREVFQPFHYGPRNCIGKKYVLPRIFLFPSSPERSWACPVGALANLLRL